MSTKTKTLKFKINKNDAEDLKKLLTPNAARQFGIEIELNETAGELRVTAISSLRGSDPISASPGKNAAKYVS